MRRIAQFTYIGSTSKLNVHILQDSRAGPKNLRHQRERFGNHSDYKKRTLACVDFFNTRSYHRMIPTDIREVDVQRQHVCAQEYFPAKDSTSDTDRGARVRFPIEVLERFSTQRFSEYGRGQCCRS